MTENKRFTIEEWDIWDYADSILVIFKDGKFISNKEVVDLLNELSEEKKNLESDVKKSIGFITELCDGFEDLLKKYEIIETEKVVTPTTPRCGKTLLSEAHSRIIELEKENEKLTNELKNLRRLSNELYMEGSE